MKLETLAQIAHISARAETAVNALWYDYGYDSAEALLAVLRK